MSFSSDTIAALATPIGTAALALVRASGPQAAALVPAIFGLTGRPRVAQHADYRDVEGTLVDDVVFTFFARPNSFSGEDTLEISCHGNPFIAQRILEDLFARGCRPAEPGEFTKRAFLNGRLDLAQAEAVMDLIHARSERALAAANQQLRGALGRQMEALSGQLVRALAHLEAYIDFPDEDLPPDDRARLQLEVAELQRGTDRLLATSHYGEVLREGIRTVILGEPNAGKSSLLNRLVGHERALVSAEPGTTRDYLEERISVGPHWLRLIDTAGLNPAPGEIERRGMELALEQAASADLFLWVVDRTRPRPTLPPATAARVHPGNTILVLNKSDLPPGPAGEMPEVSLRAIPVSALTGFGCDQLMRAMAEIADSFQHQVGEDLIAINARHARALGDARDLLGAASDKLKGEIDYELISSDLRGALAAFGEIAGKIDHEKVLDELFKTFCIGK